MRCLSLDFPILLATNFFSIKCALSNDLVFVIIYTFKDKCNPLVYLASVPHSMPKPLDLASYVIVIHSTRKVKN